MFAMHILRTCGQVSIDYNHRRRVVASPGSSHAGRDDRINKMAEAEELRVGYVATQIMTYFWWHSCSYFYYVKNRLIVIAT